MRHFLVVCATLALVLMCACSGGEGSPAGADQPAGDFAGLKLPAPSELNKLASAPPSDYERYRGGSYYAFAYPTNLYYSDSLNSIGIFMPDYPAGGSAPLSKAAYAMYSFANMQDYDGPAQLNTGWLVPPTDFGNGYFGVANFADNRWDWFAMAEDGSATLPGWVPYVAGDGEVIVTVLMLGTDSCTLSSLVLGKSVIAYTMLTSDLNEDPALNIAPLTVNFTGGAVIYNGELSGYDWDFDGDGSAEVTGELTGLQQHVYTEPGNYTCILTTNVSDGNSSETAFTFTVVDPSNTPPVAQLTGDFSLGDAPLPVHLDASGSTDDDTIILYQWDLDEDGEFEQSGPEPEIDYTFMRYGSTAVTVQVTDNDYATATAQFFVYLDSGWRTTVIAEDLNIPGGLSMAVQGSSFNTRACVTWCDLDDDDVFFARATTDLGHTWAAPVNPIDPALKVYKTPVLLVRPATNQPQLAFIHQDEDFFEHLAFAEATSEAGGSWSAPLTIAGPGHFDYSLAAATNLAGNPAVVAIAGIGESLQLTYYVAGTPGGTDWSAIAVGNAGTEADVRGVGLLIDGGLPLISVLRPGANAVIGCYSASLADGSAWDEFNPIAPLYEFPAALKFVDGRPAIAAGTNNQGNRMYFIRADDSAGKNWSMEPLELTTAPGRGGQPSLAIIGGVPVIAYRDWVSGAIMYRTAADAAGTAWNDAVVVDSRGNLSEKMALVSSNGFPVICYVNNDTEQLLAGSWF